uniref:SPRY domain-containing protein 7 n=1 Tax=Amphiprion ocellaris TaxID=80972 RepID=A0AAQ5XFB3_AMPOC
MRQIIDKQGFALSVAPVGKVPKESCDRFLQAHSNMQLLDQKNHSPAAETHSATQSWRLLLCRLRPFPGTDVVIVKSGRRICGTGGCLANAPLHQNKSYFEFKIQSTGVWGVGVATQKVNLNQVPLGRDTNSLVLRHDGSVYHNNEEKNRLPANSLPQEGDIVGITYDHVELNLYLNGKNMHCPASGIRGTVYPVVYVDDSAILDCQFSDFYHTAPQGFEKILFEQQIF